jgi:hypothetical protein
MLQIRFHDLAQLAQGCIISACFGSGGALTALAFTGSAAPLLMRGAIGAFSTRASPHSGQMILRALRCVSKAAPSRNQASKTWSLRQVRSKRIIGSVSNCYGQ